MYANTAIAIINSEIIELDFFEEGDTFKKERKASKACRGKY